LTRRIQNEVERALARSNADATVVVGADVGRAYFRWANNSMLSAGAAHSLELTVIAFIDKPGGTAAGVTSGTLVSDNSAVDVVQGAILAASSAQPSDDAAPLCGMDGSRVSGTWWDEPCETLEPEGALAFVLALRDCFRRAEHERRKSFGFAQHTTRSLFLATSSGLFRRFDESSAYVDMVGRDRAGRVSAWAGAAGRSLHDIGVPGLDGVVSQRIQWSRRRLTLRPGRYEVILAPSAVAQLILPLYLTAGAREATEERTSFSNRLGKRLCQRDITLRSNPHESGLECLPFVVTSTSGLSSSVFDNGLALAPTQWIADGVVSALFNTRAAAARSDAPVTPYIENLILEGRNAFNGICELVRLTERALLITSLSYVRPVDPHELLLTGVTRDGVFRVERGEIVGAVNNFRFVESPLRMLERVIDIGQTEHTIAREWGESFPHIAMPALRVEGFNMSSTSRAV
jgi:predicted Zn-dependent protease